MDDFIKDLKSKNKEFSDEYIEMMKAYYQKLMNNPSELQNTPNPLKKKLSNNICHLILFKKKEIFKIKHIK